jgi:pSer/pThr/pTyr-binding forkhead associated (FHA) protein
MPQEITLIINSPAGEQIRTLDAENLTVGRTELSDLILSDAGLSRRHTTFEQHDGEVWIFDENSTNGTFLNGKQINSEGARVFDGDEIRLGDNTRIFVQIRSSFVDRRSSLVVKSDNSEGKKEQQQSTNEQRTTSNEQRTIVIAAGVLSVFIISLALVGVFIVAPRLGNNTNAKNSRTPDPVQTEIGQAIIDPLKKDPTNEEIDDLLKLLEETQEEIKTEDIEDVTIATKDATTEDQKLTVTRAFWEQQKARALEPRANTGERPAGLDPPAPLSERGVPKQTAKIRELINVLNYKVPMDFADLAEKRLKGELIELPMATDDYFLEVGSSATEDAFTSFDFETQYNPIPTGSEKYRFLSNLSQNFGGLKYDLSNGRDRKQMRIRLLRMFHPSARKVLEEIAAAYKKQFNRPLRVTSLTRSMDYQIKLNQVNPNSFKVRGPGSLPPHTSGCTFDLGRKHMSADEQNFVMRRLADLESKGVLDALIEYNVNACFHVFIYPDGKPPR